MIPLFGEPGADGRRDVLEGRLITLGLRAVRLGINVVLDFGCWAHDERAAIRWLARSVGASCQIVYWRWIGQLNSSGSPCGLWAQRVVRSRCRRRRLTGLGSSSRCPTPQSSLMVTCSSNLNWPAWAADRWPSLDTTETPR